MESATKSTNESKYIEDFLDEMDARRTQGLELVKKLQQNKHDQLEKELERLSKKYGSNHPRVHKIKSRLNFDTELFKTIDGQIRLSRLKMEEFDPRTWRIQGFVFDTNNRPLSKLRVMLEIVIVEEPHEKEKPQATSLANESDQTDENGFYSITLDQKRIKNLQASGLGIAVFEGQKRVYSSSQLHHPVEGMIDLEDAIVDRKGMKDSSKNTANVE